MKYFILAGEASGDLHSAALAEALRQKDPEAQIAGWGGDEMSSAGVRILKHYRELAFMGFVEVLKHLPEIFRNFRKAKAQITAFAPDALILTDYPGFNLRMAKWAHKKGYHVYYYISPQLWAWKESRVKTVRRSVDRMYVILPFEKAFYERHGIDVDYVGHPLAWRIAQSDNNFDRDAGQPDRIILLPGSRKREIADMLPPMLAAAARLDGHRVFVAGAPSISPQFYYDLIARSSVSNVVLTMGYTYHLLPRATVALCTSGTATLETALFNVPQVVCYKGDRISYLIAKRLIKVPYIAMVNLICNKEVVPELIQDDFNVQHLVKTVEHILTPDRKAEMLRDYRDLRQRLNTGNPAQYVADDIIQRLQS
jgi:lipid-A-disaccharide synthase